MSDTSDIEPVEEAVEPQPVGLPRALQALSQVELTRWITDALRKPTAVAPDPVATVPDEQP